MSWFIWICAVCKLSTFISGVQLFNPVALRKAKIVYNFGLSERSRVKIDFDLLLLLCCFTSTVNI